MKPLIVEYVFDCYSNGKYRSTYDAVDGVQYMPNEMETGALSGDSEGVFDFRMEEAIQRYNIVPQLSGELDPEEEARARGLGLYLRELADGHLRAQAVIVGTSVVQFQNPCIFVKSTQGFADITIVRSGNSALVQNIAWKTRDNTAKAGQHYVMAEGNVSFQPGETQKVIKVQLLSDYEENNINFKIDLLDSRPVNIGCNKTQNVNIVDYDDLSGIVKRTIQHIIRASVTSVSDVISTFSEKPTVETFKAALLLLCSNANSLPHEMIAAFDLMKFALRYVPRDHLISFVTQYFQNAPDVEEMDIEKDGSDLSEDSNTTDNEIDMSEEDSDLD